MGKETKWRYDRVEKAARIVGPTRDCVHRSLVKVLFAVGGNKLWSHCEFCVSGGFGERRALSPLKWPRGEMRARCRDRNWASHRHSQFWGWHKVVPGRGVLIVSNSYSTGIPWSKRNIDARNP